MMPRNDGEPMRGIRVYQQEKIMFDIQEELKKLPSKPGVYLMHNAQDEIIYVGKAVSLKKPSPPWPKPTPGVPTT